MQTPEIAGSAHPQGVTGTAIDMGVDKGYSSLGSWREHQDHSPNQGPFLHQGNY